MGKRFTDASSRTAMTQGRCIFYDQLYNFVAITIPGSCAALFLLYIACLTFRVQEVIIWRLYHQCLCLANGFQMDSTGCGKFYLGPDQRSTFDISAVTAHWSTCTYATEETSARERNKKSYILGYCSQYSCKDGALCEKETCVDVHFL